MTNKYIIQHILQEEFISFFRADIKPTIAAQRSKQDTEEFKEAAANSANKIAKQKIIFLGGGLQMFYLLPNHFVFINKIYLN